jgi:hypothetical protein
MDQWRNVRPRPNVHSMLLFGAAIAEARWQQKDRKEGFGTWSLDEAEPDNTNTHTARPESD